jgi:demethylmenaquinone methyltransferase/2-methoxy-6-polyprenyl-1,4-benzoquinol methylase
VNLLQEQIDYYRARAGEYDEWWLRQGRYDRGPADNARWFAEIAQVRAELENWRPRGDVLELACGTGIWSVELARFADTLTLVDSSPEVLGINASRVRHPSVTHVQADLFEWQPTQRYDTVFFSFWLSHVPLERFAPFWSNIGRWLQPGGRAFFIDSLYDERSTARDHQLHGAAATTINRTLNDGRAYRIVKVFYRPPDLQARLEQLGWRALVRGTPAFFLYGWAER